MEYSIDDSMVTNIDVKYTKEPWYVVAVDNMYEIFSESEEYNVAWSIDSETNARRIVACVNACVDIDDEKLRIGYVKELEKENERLKGIVHNLDHRLITNGEWSKV